MLGDETCVVVWPKKWNDLNEKNVYEQGGYICEWGIDMMITIPEDAYSYNGHYYKVYDARISWSAAKTACEKLGGHLCTITSQAEQDFIESINNGDRWIGGYRDGNSNDQEWKWVTGEPWGYTNWGEDEPNNSSNVVSNENRVVVWPKEWNDLNDNNLYEQGGYICEWGIDEYEDTPEDVPEEIKDINDLSIADIPDQIYTGYPIAPAVSIKDKTNTVISSSDCTLEYFDNINAGRATVKIWVKGYEGARGASFNIVAKDACNLSLSHVADQTYTGEPITPGVVVKDGDKTLVYGSDYTIEYKDNLNVGTATLIVNGKGNYTGSNAVTFEILEAEKPQIEVSVSPIADQIYTGDEITPAVIVKEGKTVLKEGRHYTVEYYDNIDIGVATVEITGIGDYEGVYETVTFDIVEKPAVTGNVIVAIDDDEKGYNDLGTALKAIVNRSGDIIITINEDLTETRSLTLPRSATSVTFTSDDAITLTLKNSSLIFKCPTTIENLTLVRTNGKPVALTSKKAMTLTDSNTGSITAYKELEITNSIIDGKITAKDSLRVEGCETKAINCTDKGAEVEISDSTVDGAIRTAADLTMIDSSVTGNLSSKGIVSIDGSVAVSGSISTLGLSSEADGSVLSYRSLSVTKYGFLGENDLTLCVVDKFGDPVEYTAGNRKSIAVKSFKGIFSDETLLISEENCSEAKLSLKNKKLYVVDAE